MLRVSRTTSGVVDVVEDETTTGSDGEGAREQSPASRLRAAISRLPPESPYQAAPASETDSDFDPIPSARKSLKDVFSRAMRDSSTDSPLAKRYSNLAEDEREDEDTDRAQHSDSGIPISSQAASLQLLRQRLDFPDSSAWSDSSRPTAKGSKTNQDLHHILQNINSDDETEDHSLETERPSPGAQYRTSSNLSKRDANKSNLHKQRNEASSSTTNGKSSRTSSPSRASVLVTPPRRPSPSANIEFDTPTPPKGMLDLPDPPSSDEDENKKATTSTVKTPRPPGGWYTPISRAVGTPDSSPSLSVAPGRTPAPPGGWRTPANPKKGILKNSTLAYPFADSETFKSIQHLPTDEDVTRKKGITLVDSFGRERKFEADGTEIALPPVAGSKDLSPSKRAPSVRVVDSLGNQIRPTTDSPDVSSDYGELDKAAVVARMSVKISDIKQDLEGVEARHAALTSRRLNGQSIPHDRILELAMESRGARIEREKLIRQSHLVKSQHDELSAKLESLKRGPTLPRQFVELTKASLSNKWLFLVILLAQLLILSVLYSSARAYIRYYFLTSYYDPFFATVDPASVYGVPFVRFHLIPSRWTVFTVPSTSQTILDTLAQIRDAHQHLQSFLPGVLASSNAMLPS